METVRELLDHLGKQMKALDSGLITIDQAKAQASLVKQSNNLLRYDLDVQKFTYKVKQES